MFTDMSKGAAVSSYVKVLRKARDAPTFTSRLTSAQSTGSAAWQSLFAVTPCRHLSLLFSHANYLDTRDQTSPTHSTTASPDCPISPTTSDNHTASQSKNITHHHSNTGQMVEKKIPRLYGTFVFPDDPPPQPTRPSLFPTRKQVASLRGLPLPPPRAVPQPPQPNVTATTQEVGLDVAAAESSDVDMADAPSPLEYAQVNADNERKSFNRGNIY